MSEARPPDLVLGIGLDWHGFRPSLRFELDAHAPALGIHARKFEHRTLPEEPKQLLKSFFDRAHAQDPADGIAPFADFGAYLYDALIPDPLGEALHSLLEPVRSLQIQSEEPWIPWELVRLRDGPFLCEAFDLSRWLGNRPQPLSFPFANIALAAPRDSELDVDEEIRFLGDLAGPNRRVERIVARPGPVREACSSGLYDTFHFSGHGRTMQLADRAEIRLEENTVFSPINLHGAARRLGDRRPFVFLNGCHTGRSGFSLTGLGGWAEHLLAIGCGGFAGTHWAVDSDRAGAFSRHFYGALMDGAPMARAFRDARTAIRSEADPTWLAYTLYAHPHARLAADDSENLYVPPAPTFGKESILLLPEPTRLRVNPAAVLRAEHQVVPFHGRDRELGDLYEWAVADPPAAVRLYTGAGGMGKTRLALEIARHLRDERWQTGFLLDEEASAGRERNLLESLTRTGKPSLIIMDYAESRRDRLVSLLRRMQDHRGVPVRLLLLARGERDWWTRLKAEGRGVGDFLHGPRTSLHALAPLAPSRDEKEASYRLAAAAFSEALDREIPREPPENIDAPFYDRVLLIHMSALVKMEGHPASTEEGILDAVLSRERRFWKRRAEDWQLPPYTVTGIGRALALITLTGGAETETAAVDTLRKLRFFRDRENDLLVAVVRLLRECYPGQLWIEPLLPDTLGTHLFRRELDDGADELLELAIGLDPHLAENEPETAS